MANVWQIKGATISQNNAIKQYNVSKEDLQGLECRWRVFHGNSYPVFRVSDVQAVARQKMGDTKFEAMQVSYTDCCRH